MYDPRADRTSPGTRLTKPAAGAPNPAVRQFAVVAKLDLRSCRRIEYPLDQAATIVGPLSTSLSYARLNKAESAFRLCGFLSGSVTEFSIDTHSGCYITEGSI